MAEEFFLAGEQKCFGISRGLMQHPSAAESGGGAQ
jgi:hypothetical protein